MRQYKSSQYKSSQYKSSQYKSSQSGFTLIEAAIVMLIGGLIITVAASMLVDYMQETRLLTTQSRMQDIQTALTQYINVNGVLPCPASMTIGQDTATFGIQSAPTALGCTVVAGTWAMALGVTAGINGAVVIGTVPVRSLGLPDQDIADAWGDRFAYAVTSALTIAGQYNQTYGAIAVVDSGTPAPNYIAPAGTTDTPTTANPAAQYVIVSYGADHAGAYTLAGVKSAISCPNAPAATETPNCAALATGVPPTFVKSILYSNQSGKNMYDDYVTFLTLPDSTGTVPSGMVAPFATACPIAGWQPYFGAACTPLPPVVCCQKQ